jgi:hypothetical protein
MEINDRKTENTVTVTVKNEEHPKEIDYKGSRFVFGTIVEPKKAIYFREDWLFS